MNQRLLITAAAIVFAASAKLQAGAPCCESCGCQPCTRKVCRLVCETKEEIKKTYCCKCEDFCIPGRSTRCKNPCDCHWWCCLCCDHYTYKPTCGCVRQRVVLETKEEKKKVPAYKCVVEEVCTRCGHCAKKLDYPSAEDAQTAMAMVKDPAIDHIDGIAEAMAAAAPLLAPTVTPMSGPAASPSTVPAWPATEPVAQASATEEVASRSFVDRLLLRR